MFPTRSSRDVACAAGGARAARVVLVRRLDGNDRATNRLSRPIASIAAGRSPNPTTRPTTGLILSASTRLTISRIIRSPSSAGAKFQPMPVFKNSTASGGW